MNYKLFNIYHSFLYKKWYLLLYLLLLFATIVGVMMVITYTQMKDERFRIGLVDNDQSSETRLILKSIGDGKSIGNNLELKQMPEHKAERLLKQNKLDGYFVLDKGMTDSFYKYGTLPISVYTYDKSSVRSVVIYQLTDSVYSRLMLSMGGIKSYKVLYPEASREEMLEMMTDMLFTGLNRNGAFDEQPVKLYNSYAYYTVSAIFISIYLFYLSLFSVLKMNQEHALLDRLSLLRFSIEKLTFARSIVTLFYTISFTVFMLLISNMMMNYKFEYYNLQTLIMIMVIYLILISGLLFFIDCCFTGMLNILFKAILTIVIILFSGATIPSVYFKGHNDFLYEQPFSYIFNQLVELLLNNYLIDQPGYLWLYLVLSVLTAFIIWVWRYRR
ncbi:ABC transporter permease [Macrococcus psychrotolerans]|uniref:ABC transporter permease n=1 Tax=Macrococcus psychrotolerans TaxID=3039389 RepID=A0AAT9P4B9_9STAP|nr:MULTISPECIES: ABC transporter permease [Macrococcus]QYA32969.1 ABC transporter permease [Macrococcus sp. 19Msa1099]QYA37780.1 ABC transporter permease [Macrococcus caseolyticus]QYA76487.1 ABC transporter permease [Macrococcus caseolyticus]